MSELTIGALAKRTGLTIRTLHHYDEIRLLSPSGRTDAGYRLYSDADIRRLERIVLLRGFGMSLVEIGVALEADGRTLLEMLERQAEIVDAQLQDAARLRARLTGSIAQLRQHDTPSIDDALALIEAAAAYERYFSEEQRATLRARAEQLGPERIRAAEGQWSELIPAVQREMDAGTPPSHPRVLALAEEWQSLLDEFTNGRWDIAAAAGRMMYTDPTARGRIGAMGLTSEMMTYVAEAIGRLEA